MCRRVLRAVVVLLVVGVTTHWILGSHGVSAAERPPVLAVEAPSSQPQGYWICVQWSNGQCVKQKSCIRWQGATCEMWVYVHADGGYYCTGANWWQVVSCPTVMGRAIPGSGPRLPLEAWAGELSGADDRPTGVRIRILVWSGRAVLAQAWAEECGPSQRAAMAMLASAWAQGPQAQQVWSRGGCEVTVTHREFPGWIRTLAQGPVPADAGGQDPGGPVR